MACLGINELFSVSDLFVLKLILLFKLSTPGEKCQHFAPQRLGGGAPPSLPATGWSGGSDGGDGGGV